MTNIKITILLFLTSGFIACNSNAKTENNKEISVETNHYTPKKINEIVQLIPLKNLPIIDTTNFDNIIKLKEFNAEEIKLLQLNKIYPEIEKKGTGFKIYPAYKLELSDQYFTLIVNIFKGEHELESVLINYEKDEKLTSFKIIAYDEIAEGWSRKFSKIENNIITIIDEFYGDNIQIDTTKFHINRFGEINPIETSFSSNLRINKSILLNHFYTDTIEFTAYNDNGDYFTLEGKKREIHVSLIYNWEEHNDNQYDFKHGDFIKIKWKMDSIYIAGDGETLDFSERAIDAERILLENIPVKSP